MKFFIPAILSTMLFIPSFATASTAEETITFTHAQLSGKHIQLLQTILNEDNRTMVATRGIGSPGNETEIFGPRTRDAVMRFQELHRDEILTPLGLSRGTGKLGTRTLAALEKIRAGRLSITIHSTPITDLHAHEHPLGAGDGPHSKWYNSEIPITVPRDMWVTSFIPEMHGAEIEILHHAMVFRIGEPNAVCPDIERNARELYAVSTNSVEEPVNFPQPYALHLKKGDQLYMEVMVHNPAPPLGPGKDVENAEFSIRMSGVPGEISDGQFTPLEFTRIKLDDSPCKTPLAYVAFKVPANTLEYVKKDEFFGKGTTTPSGTFVMPHDATIIGVGANIWPGKGGQAMRMTVNGEQKAEILAKKKDATIPWNWSLPLLDNESIPVKKGDHISGEAVYSNPNPFVIPDASGMLGFYYTAGTPAPQ